MEGGGGAGLQPPSTGWSVRFSGSLSGYPYSCFSLLQEAVDCLDLEPFLDEADGELVAK